MTHRLNRRDLGELFRDEARQFDRQYGEHLSELEAAHVRRTKARTEAEKSLSGLRETEEVGNQVSQA